MTLLESDIPNEEEEREPLVAGENSFDELMKRNQERLGLLAPSQRSLLSVEPGEEELLGAEQPVTLYGSLLSNYFNRADVRKAFHVPDHVPSYDTVNEKIRDEYVLTSHGSGIVTDVLKKNGYKMLHIIGNTDGGVTLLGVRRWIKALKWKKTEEQRPWLHNNDEDFVGYIHTWDNYQVASIQGRGHRAIYIKANET